VLWEAGDETIQNQGVITPLAETDGVPTFRRRHGPIEGPLHNRGSNFQYEMRASGVTTASVVERSFGRFAITMARPLYREFAGLTPLVRHVIDSESKFRIDGSVTY
jgi:hypothetical protein